MARICSFNEEVAINYKYFDLCQDILIYCVCGTAERLARKESLGHFPAIGNLSQVLKNEEEFIGSNREG